jgi:hypothetical protein
MTSEHTDRIRTGTGDEHEGFGCARAGWLLFKGRRRNDDVTEMVRWLREGRLDGGGKTRREGSSGYVERRTRGKARRSLINIVSCADRQARCQRQYACSRVAEDRCKQVLTKQLAVYSAMESVNNQNRMKCRGMSSAPLHHKEGPLWVHHHLLDLPLHNHNSLPLQLLCMNAGIHAKCLQASCWVINSSKDKVMGRM